MLKTKIYTMSLNVDPFIATTDLSMTDFVKEIQKDKGAWALNGFLPYHSIGFIEEVKQ